ncbi:DNA-binding response regulator, NarL/FixJ family, contains REC and HTH domains [Actinoplanes derwentensis]|uniref:DNA-binding response regulator, NarL/FixJ family, contains REC and HTH domains n=1 Tax=Actinoplanes derwentensis TaxID=113562 RepID=A0A1H1VGX0_9ACTN|nr:DNA-binding response regulator, NarL/FixJ family, contains REC and HTH domains [Actinoplanes derwentensis]
MVGPCHDPAVSIRVLLVDDQALVRAGFVMVLSAQPDMTVVGEAGDGAQALTLLDQVTADVVVMDIRMPVMDGVEATRRICADPGGPRVLVLTTFDTDDDAFAALQAGASAFLLKNSPPEQLLEAIRTVAAGESVVAPRVTRALLDRFAGQLTLPGRADERLSALTEREREVLELVATGRSNAEIAGRLHVAESTVKTHFGRILAKLELRDRVHAVVFAYEIGLVKPGP